MRSSFVYDNRIIFSIILLLSIFFRFYSVKNKKNVFTIHSKILIFTFCILGILDLIKDLYASALGSLMIVFIIIVFNTYNFEETFKQIITLNQFNNILSLFFLISAFLFIDENSSRNFFGLSLPFILSYTGQASLIPALLMLPISIYLLFYERYQKFYFIILTILMCLGGNAYMAIIVASILFFFIGRISKSLFICLPFILIIFNILFSAYFVNTFLPKSEEKNIIQNAENVNFNDWAAERTESGNQRIACFYEQFSIFEKNIFYGSSSSYDFQSLGSIIIKFGIRGGSLTLISISLFYVFLLKELYMYNKLFPDRKLGVVLLYSLIIQSVVYNEMGFFSHYSIALLFIACELLRIKNNTIIINEAYLPTK